MRRNHFKLDPPARQGDTSVPWKRQLSRPRRPWGLFAIAVLLVGVSVLALQADPPPPELGGRAVAIDGDSLRLGKERIRLLGIDAPEFGQSCGGPGSAWACGREARVLLADLVRGAGVACRAEGYDKYGRILARCLAAETDLGAAMAEAGLAVSDGRYKAEEARARNAKIGIWNGAFELPRDWRRSAAAEDAEAPLATPRPSRFERFVAWVGNWLGELTRAMTLR